MFTGIVQEVGTVDGLERGADGARLRLRARLARELAPGDSVAVAGACLTAAAVGEGAIEAEVMNETLSVTTLGGLEPGDRVNLEPAMRPSDRLGGHIVQGHVDGVAEVAEVSDDGFARRLRASLDGGLARYLVERGSVALDGVSLTVAALGEGWLEVSLIPETLERTTLGEASPGRRLNVECDVLAKHVERLLRAPDAGR